MVLALLATIFLSVSFVRTEQRRAREGAGPEPVLASTDQVSSPALAEPVAVDRRDRFEPFYPLPEKPVIIERPRSEGPVAPKAEVTVPHPTQPVALPPRKLIHSFVLSRSKSSAPKAETPAASPGEVSKTPSASPVVSARAFPVGSLIPCRTIHEVVAGAQASMIAAVLTDDVRRADGRLVRAGQMVYGTTAQVHGNRLHAGPRWNVEGETITAQMLDRRHDHETGLFAYGAAGVAGSRLDRPYKHTGKILMSTAASALARSFRSTAGTVFGEVPRQGLGNAGLEAGAAVIDQHTQFLHDQARESQRPRLRVPQGTAFYLFVDG